MKFAKDILLIDFEGLYEPAQIGAVLLDRESLVEKNSFCTYIYADLKGRIGKKSGITQGMLAGAPTPAEVGKMLFEKFGTDIFIASWVANLDTTHLKKLMDAASISCWDVYDYHVLDIWPAAYIYLLKHGYIGGIGSEEMFQAFGTKPRGLHDALEDCRIAADVLRRIVASE